MREEGPMNLGDSTTLPFYRESRAAFTEPLAVYTGGSSLVGSKPKKPSGKRCVFWSTHKLSKDRGSL
jgi:hypothetical protein